MAAIAARCAARSRTNATPQSYGTLSHLWASVAHESAARRPHEVPARRAGGRPQPERAVDVDPRSGGVRGGADRSIGSQAPPLTLPTCANTIVGPSVARASASASASARIAPRRRRPPARRRRSRARAAGARDRRSRDAPRRRARGCAAPRTGRRARRREPARRARDGAPPPGRSRGPSGSRSRARRTRSAGSPSSSTSQRPATSSKAAAAGVGSARPAFWSHAVVSQSAAIAAGWAPPITKPKKRGELIAVSPGAASRTSSAMTSPAGSGAAPSASVTRISAGSGPGGPGARRGCRASRPRGRRPDGAVRGSSRRSPSARRVMARVSLLRTHELTKVRECPAR